jgi:hypothetical protein
VIGILLSDFADLGMIGLSVGESDPKPQLCGGPIPLYGRTRYFQCGSYLVDVKASKKSQLDDLSLSRIRKFKFFQSFINGNDIDIALSTEIESFIQGQSHG